MSGTSELQNLLEATAKGKTGLADLLEVPDLPASLKQLIEIKYALDSSYIFAVTDPKGVIAYVNDRFCEVSRYSAGELIGKTHAIINSGVHSKDFFKSMWKTIGSGKIWQGEICNRAKDDRLYWVDTTIVPLLDSNKKPYQYLAIRNEITEKILFRQALEKLSQLSGNQEGTFENLAQELRNILGVSYVIINEFSEEGIAMKVSSGKSDLKEEFKDADESQIPCIRLNGQDDLVQNEGDLQLDPESILSKEGIHSYAGVALKNSAGITVGSLCILDRRKIDPEFLYLNIMHLFARRISGDLEREKNQYELNVQTMFAQRLSALAAMAGGVAHELNQPLSSIRIYAQMICKFLDKDSGFDPKMTAEIMDKIIAQVDRASKIITHMREFSAEKKDHCNTQPVSLREVVEHCTELVGQQLKNNYIDLEIDVNPEHEVIANSSRLEQVFINLISNSRDSVNEKQDTSKNFIKVYSELKDDKIELYFADSGSGIKGQVKEQLFEPFTTTKPPGAGTGLGLSICVGILKDFQGSISLHETGPQGTTFKLTFPKA